MIDLGPVSSTNVSFKEKRASPGDCVSISRDQVTVSAFHGGGCEAKILRVKHLAPAKMQDSLSVSGAGSTAKQLFSRTASLPFASCADTPKRTVMRSGPEPKTCSAPSSPSDHFAVPVRELSPLLRSLQPIRTDSLRSNIYKREQR